MSGQRSNTHPLEKLKHANDFMLSPVGIYVAGDSKMIDGLNRAVTMKTLMKSFISLVISCCLVGYTFAQNNPEVESVSPAESKDLKALIKTLAVDIASLELLSEGLASAGKMDRKALIYRQDERSFKLLTNFDALVTKFTSLPDGSPLKEETKAQLITQGEGVGLAIFKRIQEIRQRVIDAHAELSNLSGSSQIIGQAYIDSLESINIKYFGALANHLDSRKTLELSSETLREQLTPKLYLYAETIVGRLEVVDAASRQARYRFNVDSDNADIDIALKNLAARHNANVLRLKAVIQVLDRLRLDSANYKAVMLRQSGALSVNFFSPDALVLVFQESISSLASALAENAPDIFFALFMLIAVLFIFRTLSRITKRAVSAACERSSLDMSRLLQNILVSTSGGIVMIVGILMALSQLGISLAPMLAGLGVAGFIIGFALQDTLGNFAAGAMILIYRPFDVDDFVEVTGASGLVKKMNLVSTTIATYDNQILVVPNSKIWGDVIKNVTSQSVRRVDLEFGVSYSDDIEKTERVLAEILSNHEMVLKKPEPMIRVHTLGDSSVNFAVRPWVKTEDYWNVYWDITREVKMRFDREGISIPFPQRDVHLHSEQT